MFSENEAACKSAGYKHLKHTTRLLACLLLCSVNSYVYLYCLLVFAI